MKEEMKQKWLGALRSGEYKQGRQALKINAGKNASYCCLGVLCAINGVRFHPRKDEWADVTYYGVGTERNEGFPTYSMSSKWGLTYDLMQEIVNMNDTGKSFEEIAEFIEKNL